MNSNMTIGLLFKVLDQATAPIKRVNETLGVTGSALTTAAGKSIALNTGLDRLGTGAAMAARVASGVEMIGKAPQAATSKLDALQKKTEKIGTSAEKLSGLGTPMAGVGAVGSLGIGKTIKDFAALEDAQKQLRITLMDEMGKVGPEFEKLNALGEKLGTDLPGSTKDMLNMFTALREQGVKTNYILGGVGEAAAKFAVLMKVDFSSAATSVAKLSEAMGIDDSGIVKFMDTLSRLKTAAGVDVAGLLETFKYLGATMKTLKIQGQPAALETAAAIGMLAQNSLDGSTAGTNYANALASLAKMKDKLEGKKMQAQIAPMLDKHRIKLEFWDNKGEFVGQRKMIAELGKLNVLSSVDKMNVLNRLFSVEGGRALSVFVEKGVKGLDEMLEKMRKQADMNTKIKELMSSTSKKWETMTGTMDNFTAHLGGVFAKLINLPGILDKMNGLFGKMDSWVLLNPKAAGIIAGVAVGVTGLSMAGGVLLLTMAGLGAAVPRALEGLTILGKGAVWATGRFTALHLAMQRKWIINRLPDAMFGDLIPGAAKAQTGIRGVIAATRALNLSMLLNPVGLTIAGIAAGALLIIAYWKPIKAFFGGLWLGFKEGLSPLKELFISAWAAAKPLREMFAPVIGFIKQLLTPLDFANKILSTTALIGKGIGYVLAMAFTTPIYAITGILKAIKMLFTNTKLFFSAGATIAKSIGNGILSAINSPVEAIKKVVEKVRRFLPFSPAKEGPLRDINRVRIVETIAESMKPAPMLKAMRAVTAATMLAAPVGALAQPANRTMPTASELTRSMSTGGQGAVKGGSVTLNYNPTINFSGDSSPATEAKFADLLRQHSREIERIMADIDKQQQRRAF